MSETESNFLDLILKTVKVSGDVEVLHKPGAVKLDGYPLLTFAPLQHGAGIRTEDNGTPVSDIADAAAASPDLGTLAAKFGTSEAHVADALKYAVATGYATND
jgi:hypothetical protein